MCFVWLWIWCLFQRDMLFSLLILHLNVRHLSVCSFFLLFIAYIGRGSVTQWLQAYDICFVSLHFNADRRVWYDPRPTQIRYENLCMERTMHICMKLITGATFCLSWYYQYIASVFLFSRLITPSILLNSQVKMYMMKKCILQLLCYPLKSTSHSCVWQISFFLRPHFETVLFIFPRLLASSQGSHSVHSYYKELVFHQRLSSIIVIVIIIIINIQCLFILLFDM